VGFEDFGGLRQWIPQKAVESRAGTNEACGVSALAVLEEFDLAEALLGFFFGFVWAAHVFSLAGEDLVAAFHFLDHGWPPRSVSTGDASEGQKVSGGDVRKKWPEADLAASGVACG
jgi:hypothetical protein